MKRKYIIYCIIAGVVLFGTSNVVATDVSIILPSNDVWVGDVFTITVQCDATQPIKAWETQLVFDNGKMVATEVEEGNIFKSEFQTFFNPGQIDNTNGQIINMYDLILGQGNITTNDSMVFITFEATEVGYANLNLEEVGVTNEYEYIPINVFNNSVPIHSICDVNTDMDINVLDLTSISNHYWEMGTPGWIPEDVDDSGKIRVLDLAIVSNEM